MQRITCITSKGVVEGRSIVSAGDAMHAAVNMTNDEAEPMQESSEPVVLAALGTDLLIAVLAHAPDDDRGLFLGQVRNDGAREEEGESGGRATGGPVRVAHPVETDGNVTQVTGTQVLGGDEVLEHTLRLVQQA